MPRKDALLVKKIPQGKISLMFAQKEEALGKQDRPVVQTKSGLAIYKSKGGTEANFNMKALDAREEKIACRQLVYGLLASDETGIKGYHERYGSKESIAEQDKLKHNAFDVDQVAQRSSFYRFVNINRLGESLASVAEELEVGEETRLMFNSENHAMGFSITRKATSEGTQFIVKFYDPNITNSHQRIIAPSLESLRSLTIKHLIPDEELRIGYFSALASGMLYSPTPRGDDADPVIEFDETVPLKEVLYQYMAYNMPDRIPSIMTQILEDASRKASKPWDLLQTDTQGNSSLMWAVGNGNLEAATVYLEQLSRPEIPAEVKFEILRNQSDDQKIMFQRLLIQNSEDTELFQDRFDAAVQKYAEAIQSAGFPPQQMEAILAQDKKDPELGFAMFNGQAGAVRAYTQTVVGSNIPVEKKVDFLRAVDSDGKSALHCAVEQGQLECIGAYMDAVLQSDLPVEEKMSLCRSEKNNSPLIYDVMEGKMEGDVSQSAFVYLDKILQSDLPNDAKVSLCQGIKGKRQLPALNAAFVNENDAFIVEYAKTVLSSNLPPDKKMDILLTGNLHGTPVISRAIEDRPALYKDVLSSVKEAGLLDEFRNGLEARGVTEAEIEIHDKVVEDLPDLGVSLDQ